MESAQREPARKLTTAEEDELLELYRALPQNKQFEFIGELKGFLKAYRGWDGSREAGKRPNRGKRNTGRRSPC